MTRGLPVPITNHSTTCRLQMGHDKHNRCAGENNTMGMGFRQGTQEGEWAKGEHIWYVRCFLFFTHFVDYSMYSQLTSTNQTRPIDNLFQHDKKGCVLLAMSISHLDVTRRATTSLATSISHFGM